MANTINENVINFFERAINNYKHAEGEERELDEYLADMLTTYTSITHDKGPAFRFLQEDLAEIEIPDKAHKAAKHLTKELEKRGYHIEIVPCYGDESDETCAYCPLCTRIVPE